MKSLTTLSIVLVDALNSVNRTHNQVGSLHLYTTPADPDICQRVTDAYHHIVQAEGILEALRDDIDAWLRA